jgi:hypothetical protein
MKFITKVIFTHDGFDDRNELYTTLDEFMFTKSTIWIKMNYVHESNHNIDEVDNMDDKKNYMDEIEQMLKFHYIYETKFIDENDHHLYLFVCLSICVRLI